MSSEAYLEQLQQKQNHFLTLLKDFELPQLSVFPSLERHFRMRAEFRIWHEGEQIHYAMFKQGNKASSASVIRLQQFEYAHESINELMPKLLAKLSEQTVLKHKLYQCEFLCTLNGDMLVTLIYHKPLDETWQQYANLLQDELNIAIIGRSKKQKIVLKQDVVLEKLQVKNETFTYRQIEGGFTQPNAKMCEQMLTWASECADGIGGDLLELYCGNGNFTLPLSRYYQHVLATEISKTSVQAAQWNIAHNQVHNIAIARLSAEELTQALQGERVFKRLQELPMPLADYQFSTIFMDPPRAGVDEQTLQLAAQFDRIIYISCNPETLANNLHTLTQTHRITRLALFDQFPFTHHIESGVLLQKMPSA